MIDPLQAVDMGQLLQDIGFADVDPSRTTYLGYCVFHNDQNTKSFSANLDSKMFNCFGCNIKGNAIQLYARWKGIDYSKAVQQLTSSETSRSLDRLDNLLGTMTPSTSSLPSWKWATLLMTYIKSLPLLSTTPQKEYLNRRGISDKTMDDFGVRFHLPFTCSIEDEDLFRDIGVLFPSGEYRFQSYPLVFPFWYGGLAIYAQARALDSTVLPRFMGLSGIPNAMYNRDAIHTAKTKSIFICEGIIDTLSAYELGIEYAVGIPGANTSKIGWIEDLAGRTVVLALDNDPAGRAATLRLTQSLLQVGATVSNFELPQNCKDVNDLLVQRLSIIK